MTEATSSVGSDAADGPPAKPPTLEWAFRATVVWAAFTVVSAVALWSDKSYLRKALIDSNNKAASDKKRDYSGANSVLDADVRRVVISQIVVAIITALILVGIALFVRRGRPWARWLLAAFATILSVVFPVGIFSQLLSAFTRSGPGLYRVAMAIAGLASLAVVILLFMPRTSAFFRAMRPVPVTGAAPGGMFGALFGRRPVPPSQDSSTVPARPSMFGRPPARPGDAPARPAVPPPAAETETADSPAEGSPTPAPATGSSRPRTATRPGSVRPKGRSSGPQSKSRQR